MLFALIIALQLTTSAISWIGDTVKVVFIGDIMQHQTQLDAAKRAASTSLSIDSYDYSAYFKHLESRFSASDLVVANMEAPFAKPPYSGYPLFNAPVALLKESKLSGINLFLSANNHICDKGAEGIEGTIAAYEQFKVPYLGIYRDNIERDGKYPLIISLKGINIGFLNYTYGTNNLPVPPPYIVNLLDSNQIKKDITVAKERGAQVVIATLHWGEEYHLKPSPEQKRWQDLFYRNGVNLIVGMHPHVVQEVEVVKCLSGEVKSITAYSLGNAISNMTLQFTRVGMLLTLKLVREKDNNIRVLEPQYELIWTSRPGAVEDNFSILPIKDFIELPLGFKNRDEWNKMKYEYSILIK